jgi:hypothetical protein
MMSVWEVRYVAEQDRDLFPYPPSWEGVARLCAAVSGESGDGSGGDEGNGGDDTGKQRPSDPTSALVPASFVGRCEVGRPYFVNHRARRTQWHHPHPAQPATGWSWPEPDWKAKWEKEKADDAQVEGSGCRGAMVPIGGLGPVISDSGCHDMGFVKGGGTLYVTVHRAVGLRRRIGGGGSRAKQQQQQQQLLRPYVRVRLANVGQRQSAVAHGRSGGADPVWYRGPQSQASVLTFDVPGYLLGSSKRTLELGVQVLSRSGSKLARDTLLGEAKVDWLAAVSGQAVQQYPLCLMHQPHPPRTPQAQAPAQGNSRGNSRTSRNAVAPQARARPSHSHGAAGTDMDTDTAATGTAATGTAATGTAATGTAATGTAAASTGAGSIILSMTFTPVGQYRRQAQVAELAHRSSWAGVDPHDRHNNNIRPPGNSTKWGMHKIGRIAPAHFAKHMNMRARTSTIWG